MRWRGRRKSDNVVDRRGASRRPGRRAVGGGAAVLVVLAGLFFGQDASQIARVLLGAGQPGAQAPAQQAPTQNNAQQDEATQFVRVILAETEDTWVRAFAEMGRQYQPPKLILYNDMVRSACGTGSAQSGPFYCPGDYQIYIDLSFLEQLRQMGAPGDFAFAYVIAHEVGHHVQNIVGIAQQVRAQQSRSSQAQANALSVRMELQADCLAGVWINRTEKRNSILEPGDIEEGLEAAAAVGDDRIMRQAGRAPRREAFTHGSSAQRVQWFKRGMQSGKIDSCNTFG
ncbi:MAG: flagellar biosynthesis protein FlgM [Gammaproteobacteria bacterium]|nr:flagellar biosynthesis protein FlgM [Gammaproteobacteria bacterium]